MSESRALVESKKIDSKNELTRHDIVESKLYQHIKTKEQAGVVIAKAVNHDLCPTFVAENLIPIQGKMSGTGLYLAAVLGKTTKYRTVAAKTNDHTKATITVMELVPHMAEDGGPRWVEKGTETFTMEDAKRAALLSNQTWQKYPQHMLYWRALAAAARKHCADAIAGSFTHLIEELDEKASYNEDGVPIVSTRQVDILDADFAETHPVAGYASLDDVRSRVTELCATTATPVSKVEDHFGEKIKDMGPESLKEALTLLEAKLPPKPKARVKAVAK